MTDSDSHSHDASKEWRTGSYANLPRNDSSAQTTPRKMPRDGISLPFLATARRTRRNSLSGSNRPILSGDELESFSDNGAFSSRNIEDSAGCSESQIDTPRSRLALFQSLSSQTDKHTQANKVAEKQKNPTLVTLFKLPATETLLDSFACAISRTYLQQGTGYLTPNYFCFYSKACGEVKECIRLRDVVSVVKRNRFCLGIEFMNKNFERTLFSSFVNRNASFSLIVDTWKKCIGAEDAANRPVPSASEAESANDDNDAPASAAAATAESANDGEGVGESQIETLRSFINNEPLSNSPVDLNEIKTTETVHRVINSVTPLQVFHLFYSDGRPHFKRFHEMMEDKDITVENWAKGEKGFTRTNRFLSPLKGIGMGPPETRVEELNWYSLSENLLVVDTVQHSLDIPYNDYFNVHARWTFKLVDGGNTEVQTVCGVRWSKKTLLKGTIESVTIQKSKDPHNKWCDFIASELASRPASGAAARPESSGVQAASSAGVAQPPAELPHPQPQQQQQQQALFQPPGANGTWNLLGFDKSTVLLAVLALIIISLLLDISIQLHKLNGRLVSSSNGLSDNNPHDSSSVRTMEL